MTNVLFVCIGNSGRSVLAEQLFRVEAAGRHDARSAGSEPALGPEPGVVEVLAELGIDVSGHVPQKLTDTVEDVRALRDDVHAKVRELLGSLG
jgi:arsenate reductase (thioredoxin)